MRKHEFQALKTLRSREFWKIVLPLALPITLQNLLTSSFQIVDTLMIGQLGDTVIAAVGIAAQISFFSNVLFYGTVSGGSVFVAQYWGATDIHGIRKVYGLILSLILPIAAIFVIGSTFWAPQILSVFTDDPELIRIASQYLRIACWSYIGVAFNQVFCVVLRGTEEVHLPLYTNIFAVALNALANYVLIFGKFGFPEMGVEGAALATAISSLSGTGLLFLMSYLKRTQVRAPIREMFSFTRSFASHYLKRALPVLFNETLWSIGILGYNMVYGRMGADNYAALTIFRTIENLGYVSFIGMCNASAVLVGKFIGAEDHDEAKHYAGSFMLLVPIMGLCVGTIVLIFAKPILSLFNVSPSVYQTAHSLLIIYMVDVGLRNIPYASVCGVFRPGGDTKTGMKLDFMGTYLIGLPLVILCAFVFKLPFIPVYIAMLFAEDIPKGFLCIRHYLSYRWIMPVREVSEEALPD